MTEKRTTKIVSMLVELTFHGDYLSLDEVARYVETWIDAGLEDRDDLRGWTITTGPVREIGPDLPLKEI